MAQELSVVGKRLPRFDALDKATGAARYTVDIKLPGMLIGKILRSPHPHARILQVDTSKAEKIPGVVAVMTGADTPKVRFTRSKGSVTIVKPEKIVEDEMVINDKARYIGEPVAAVAAINESIAEKALELIDVKYEVLPAVFDAEDAMKPGAPKIHEDVEDNIALHTTYVEGNAAKGFQEADIIVEETFKSSKQKLCHLEPSSCIASFDSDGRLTVWSPGQHAFPFRRKISEIFGIPEGKITWITPHVGGAFGNGQSFRAEPICIALAKKAGRPVKLEYTSEEDFVGTETRQPYVLTGKIGVKKDGTITALQLEAIGNSGAYLSQCLVTTKSTIVRFCALYRCSNVFAEGYSVYTNTVVAGGHRGYGAPQGLYILEQLVDMASEKIGMDPLEFRLKNYRRTGDTSMFSVVTDDGTGAKSLKPIPIESCYLDECMRRGAERIDWKAKRAAERDGKVWRGVGMACLVHVSSAFPVDFQHSSVFIKFNEDGSANLLVSACDFGQGVWASLAQIAAEEFGVRAEDIHIVSGNTDITLYDTGQYSSRSCYIIGNSVLGAARLAKQKLLKKASLITGIPVEEMNTRDRQIYVKKTGEKKISIAEVTRQAMYDADNLSVISAEYAWHPTSNAFCFQAAFAEVEVNTESGEVKLLRVVAAHDIGKAINPTTVEGQIQGGGIQAIDWALHSDFVINQKTGVLESPNFTNYKVSSTMDVPEFDVILIEEPTPSGPFGAKSVGESSCLAIAPAIYNAVYNAIGVRIKDMPITPELILAGLAQKQDQNLNSLAELRDLHQSIGL